VKTPQDKKKVTPIYPDAARKAGVHGNVRIATILLPDGSLDDLVVLSAPSRDLAVAALVAVRQWRYSPTQLDGEPVETSFTIDVKFDR
jgi:TonB family protein